MALSREPRVQELLRETTSLTATLDLDAALNHSDMIFVLVATPNGAGRPSTHQGAWRCSPGSPAPQPSRERRRR